MQTTLTKLLEQKGKEVVALTPDASVKEAAHEMSDARIGALLIMEGEKLRGILTERDILNKIVAAGLKPSKTKVHEIMTPDVIVISPTLTVREAMKIVTEKRLRHLPVVQDGRLIGMLSAGDLTRTIVAEEEEVIDTLYEYIQGSYPV